ncbi:hypothetical protein RN001_008239 [Aquatica leii]|uniref:Regulatory protein zeste n=1 Tax=Aquatica leii TaxID=1421715 RepID=A0AAN7SP64_9COLE|nr:hypothetical protein RN001_008239 [Aquatica leii]
MEKVKRNRAPNWEQTEKNLFRELMKDEVTVIENKNTDTNTNKAKVNAWSNVLNRFNELNSRERSLNELKQQWRVLKGETKKCISTYQHELKKTGGGPKPPSPNQEILEIVDMIPNEFTTDENKFDSNYVVVPSDNTVDILESKEVEPCFSGNVDIKSNQVEPESSCFKVIQSETPSCTTSVDEKKSLKRKLPLSEVTK